MKFNYILSISILLSLFLTSCLMEEPDDPLASSNASPDVSSSGGADFYASETNIEPGETVYFTNISTGDPYSFYWDFGDGNYNYDANPVHTYYEQGSFDVSLTAYYSNGDVDTEIKYSFINSDYSGGGGSYCTSSASNNSYEWINKITIGDWSYTSGRNDGYNDFTSQTVNLYPYQSYTIVIEPEWSGDLYTEYVRVWIDYNNDMDFDDSGELVAQGSGTSTIYGTFTTSASAADVNTRMRISMSDGSYRGACDSFDYGEVEDYTVQFLVKKGIQTNDNEIVDGPVILKPKMEIIQ